MSSNVSSDPTNKELIKAKKAARRDAERVDLTSYLFRCGVSVATYPIEYAKTLIQLGYEPFEPRRTLSIFGRPCLMYPNIFQYIGYIKRVDGFFGCYRGLVAYLLHKSILIFSSDAIAQFWDGKPEGDELEEQRANIERFFQDREAYIKSLAEEEAEVEEFTFQMFLKDLARDLVCRLGGLAVSYPFLVIAIQQMSAFVGREQAMCRGVSMSMNHIWLVQGPLQYYNGFIPRLLGEAFGIIAVGVASFFIRTRISNPELRACSKISVNMLTGALSYPFTVVSTTMMVNGSGLQLGQHPFTPVYVNWLDCWAHLQETNVLRRGSSLVFRSYAGPITVREGLLCPIGVHFGPDHTQNPTLRRFRS